MATSKGPKGSFLATRLMADLPKRSVLVNGERGHSGEKPMAQQAVVLGVAFRQDRPREQEEGEVSEGSEGEAGGGALVAVEAMEEPQINMRMAVALFHCQCEAGHVVCGACRGRHGQACARARAAFFAACAEVDAFVRGARVPCAYEEFGCASLVAYHAAADHHRACRCAPCFCPEPGCGHFTSPARLAEHLAGRHAWPAAAVSYCRPCRLAVPAPPRGCAQVLVAREDGCVFLVSACALGAAATAVALVCVRANGGGGGAQFRYKLWVEVEGNRENLALLASVAASSDLSGGFVAAEQGMFLAVPPELLHDASGEAPMLMVRIDKAGAAAANSTAPSALRSRILRQWD